MRKTMSLELSPEQVQVKKSFSKQFIQIEVYAISNINPNRNRSHFTNESLEKAVKSKTFVSKPILGYWSKESDFEEHNGNISYDSELDLHYWDNSNGEQILGFIRSEDEVELVEKNGLKWIRCSALLWTNYNYKQIKRLLKDRTKKISVEVDVYSRSTQENGIEYIEEFELLGITILGSKNGKPITEGIPDAHLSIFNSLDKDIFNKQRESLSFAYNSLEKSESNIDNNKIKNDYLKEEQKLEKNKNNFNVEADDKELIGEDIQRNGDGVAEDNKSLIPERLPHNGAAGAEDDKPRVAEGLEDHITHLLSEKASLEKMCEDLRLECDDLKMKNDEHLLHIKEMICDIEKYKDIVAKYNIGLVNNYVSQYDLSEDDVKEIKEGCNNKKFSSQEDIEKEIAFIVFKKEKEKTTFKEDRFSAPIISTPVQIQGSEIEEESVENKLASIANKIKK